MQVDKKIPQNPWKVKEVKDPVLPKPGIIRNIIPLPKEKEKWIFYKVED